LKGFVHVSEYAAQSAIEGFAKKLVDGRALRDNAVQRYYIKYYEAGSWYTKWRYKGITPMEFARKHSPSGAFWGTWADILHTVLNDDEFDLLNWWSWIDKDRTDGLKALINTSQDGKILVDQDMAQFINKYGEI
jgi:hypothetical protein